MKLQQILLARAIQLGKTTTNLGWIPDLFAEVAKKYEFAVVPNAQDLFGKEPNNKAEFKHGRIGQSVIDTLAVYNDGFVADSTISTEVCESFLRDLMQMLVARSPDFREQGKCLFLSNVEVQLDFGRFGRMVGNIGQQITSFLQQYEMHNIQPFVFNSLHLAEDPLGQDTTKPSAFMIDRRLNIPFAENVFFSQAPLRTADHLLIIETLEKALGSI